MKRLLPLLLALAPSLASAEATLLDLDALPNKTVHEAATLTPLALTEAGTPLVVTLHLEAGKEVPPHAAKSGLRLLSVLSGTLHWGDGDTIDPAAERIFAPGSMLVIKPGEMHWLAARSGDLRLQLVVMSENAPTPAVKEQLQ